LSKRVSCFRGGEISEVQQYSREAAVGGHFNTLGTVNLNI